jgi:hypothetical protein
MGRHSKSPSNLEKFLYSPFMSLVMVLGIGALFGTVLALAI